MKEEIFMAYDIRGLSITTHDSFILGKALGNVFSGNCVVGHDSRGSSPVLTEHLIEGLRQSGINVDNIGLVPNPACYYKVYNNYDFGVYVTASHLPPEYNGYKIILRNGMSIDQVRFQKVKESFYKFKFKAGTGTVRMNITALNDYASFLEREFGKSDIKRVIDCFSGAASVLSKRVFSSLLKATVINDSPLPDFGGRAPEPTESNLTAVIKEVIKNKADFGVGLDGDGDRSVFVTDKGEVIDGNLMTMLFAKYLLIKKGGGIIVVPPSVSSSIEDLAKKYGGKVVWCKVGHSYIEEELVKNKGLFGGEESSHFYWNEYYPFSDGILSMLMLAKILKETKKKFGELVSELPKIFVLKDEIEFPTHKAKEAAMKRIEKDLLKFHPNALTLDGVKFKVNEGSVLVRHSVTRHTIKVFAESDTKEKTTALLKEYVDFVKGYL